MEVIPILGISVWFAAKIFILLFLGIYIIFALVVIRQIALMSGTLDMGLNLPIIFVGWAHFLFAVGIFVIALILL
jgi:hypothetical protein